MNGERYSSYVDFVDSLMKTGIHFSYKISPK